MDLYGSFSTPSDCLHIDDFLDFSNITTDTHHHLPPPQNSPLISHDDANLFLMRPHLLVLLSDYPLQLWGKPHILVLFTFHLTRFLLEIDSRVPGINTFEGLIVESGVLSVKK